MRRASKVDANQPAVIAALRKIGCAVWPTHTLGRGFPDLAVSLAGRTVLVEIKDGSLPPSRRELTPDEAEFHALWRDEVLVVLSPEDAVSAVLARCRATPKRQP